MADDMHSETFQTALTPNSSFVELLGEFEFSVSTDAPHGTTIVAARYSGGVMMVGDRRATMGHHIAMHDVRKVYAADDLTLVGIAGTAGVAFEMVKLFQTELEHFEKIEGTTLSFDGKANRLGAMLRAHLPKAMQGFGVLPLFAGWDPSANTGRLCTYDGVGGRYEEAEFAAVGSGSSYARSSIKKLYDPNLDELGCATMLMQAIFDAADDDSATGGIDLARGVLPIVMRASADGVAEWSEAGVRKVAEGVIAQRAERFGGPGGVL